MPTISKINKIIKEVQESSFNFSGGIDHLEISRTNFHDRHWRIGIRIKCDDTDSKPYAFITYQLRIGDKEFHFPPDSIGYEADAVVKTTFYSRTKFIEHLESLEFDFR